MLHYNQHLKQIIRRSTVDSRPCVDDKVESAPQWWSVGSIITVRQWSVGSSSFERVRVQVSHVARRGVSTRVSRRHFEWRIEYLQQEIHVIGSTAGRRQVSMREQTSRSQEAITCGERPQPDISRSQRATESGERPQPEKTVALSGREW